MSEAKPVTHNRSWPMCPVDAGIHTESLRVCKSLIPYLSFEKQKNISIMIKLYELMSVIAHYSDDNNFEEPAGNFRTNKAVQRDLLESVKSSLDPKHAHWVDLFFKFGDMQKILTAMQAETPDAQASNEPLESQTAETKPGPSQDFMENIAPMLDDNQKNMLEMLSTIMK